MGADTYYRDHWLTIEPERFAYYDSLVRLPEPILELLLAPLGIESGHICLDLGCGPGYVTAAMAQRTGIDGRVHGVDVNAEFIERARTVSADTGVAARCSFTTCSTSTCRLKTGASTVRSPRTSSSTCPMLRPRSPSFTA